MSGRVRERRVFFNIYTQQEDAAEENRERECTRVRGVRGVRGVTSNDHVPRPPSGLLPPLVRGPQGCQRGTRSALMICLHKSSIFPPFTNSSPLLIQKSLISGKLSQMRTDRTVYLQLYNILYNKVKTQTRSSEMLLLLLVKFPQSWRITSCKTLMFDFYNYYCTLYFSESSPSSPKISADYFIFPMLVDSFIPSTHVLLSPLVSCRYTDVIINTE